MGGTPLRSRESTLSTRPVRGIADEKIAQDNNIIDGVSEADIERAAAIICTGQVVAFTGAGVSAESGVPTYRDPGGLWRKYDMKKVSHIKNFLRDPVACWRFEMELYRLLQGVRPNSGHDALAELEELGICAGVVTQNVEGLHSSAGSRNVVELHGNETRGLCLRCGKTCPATEAFRRVGWLDEHGQIIEEALPDVSTILRKEGEDTQKEGSDSSSSSSASPSPRASPKSPRKADGVSTAPESTAPARRSAAARADAVRNLVTIAGLRSSSSSSSSSPDPLPRGEKSPVAPPGAPTCPSCDIGLLKPDAVYFGEKLDSPTLKKAEKLFDTCDVALIVGSSCRVAPASVLPLVLRKKGGKLIDVNPKGSRISDIADVWLKGPSAEVLPRLARAVKAQRASRSLIA